MENRPVPQLPALGARLRRLRRQCDLTMRRVADRTGISQPTLSRLESDHRQPTLAQLLALADVYGSSIGTLLGEDPKSAATIDPSKAVEREGNGLRLRIIDRQDDNAPLSALHVTVPAGREDTQHYQHPGDEWLYVLSGCLRLTLGDVSEVLAPGMVAHFDAETPHRLDAADERDVELLLVAARRAADRVVTSYLHEAA